MELPITYASMGEALEELENYKKVLKWWREHSPNVDVYMRDGQWERCLVTYSGATGNRVAVRMEGDNEFEAALKIINGFEGEEDVPE